MTHRGVGLGREHAFVVAGCHDGRGGYTVVLEPGTNGFKRLPMRSDLPLGEAFAIPAEEQWHTWVRG